MSSSKSAWQTKELAAAFLDGVRGAIPGADLQLAVIREIGFRDVDCFFEVFELALFGGRKSH
jgi:hypothetical protein